MGKRTAAYLAVLLLATSLVVVGCTCSGATPAPSSAVGASKTSQAPTTKAPVTTTSPAGVSSTTTTRASSAPTTTAASGNTIGSILGKSAGIASMQYDAVVTAPGQAAITQSVWVKKNKMRTESTVQGQKMVILIDGDAQTMYQYMPAQNTAIKMTWDPNTQSATGQSASIASYNPVVVGTDTIDGKLCTVVQYTVQGNNVKAWIWQDRGLPIRIETTTAQGTAVVELKNIQFVDIPDSQFTLPAGVQISQMPSLPTGLPTALPTH